ncbi:helix-turn-helix DNA-binding domain protein [Gordonia phage Banquo]|uniref:Helix-turn-helix DNA-binding domain protein n=1 Tax=Gordonia phage TinaLin TaxID=2797324 RepID=A0A7T7GTP6_9CAUD|nr:DNA binding protein [Gordonia phage TinaLin]QQM15148.1 helix-turn-helix DNA-binding domain protein [Gordonia phage TinaLin]URM87390.1 helix-turn-helix DNA-binding domain protein [Gordonia phage Banquo]
MAVVEWLTEAEAQAYIGRKRTTLWEWRRRGIVRAQKMSDGTWRYGKGSLRLARKDAERRKAEQKHVAGPGRGHKRESNPDQLVFFQ